MINLKTGSNATNHWIDLIKKEEWVEEYTGVILLNQLLILSSIFFNCLP